METTPGSCEAVQSLFLLGSWVRVRFVSGFVFGSCPVRVWVCVRVRVWFATGFGFVSGSCLGSCPGSCPGSCLLRVWLVSGFVSGSCLVVCPVRVRSVFGSCLGSCLGASLGSCLVRVWVRVWFVIVSYSGLGSWLIRILDRIWFVFGRKRNIFDMSLRLYGSESKPSGM